MSDTPLTVLGLAGSLRARSYNRALLNAAIELAPADLSIEVFDLAPIPFYNGDVEAQGDPPAVLALKERLRATDALLIATPEYNYSAPGVLKNAIDWASRPVTRSPLRHKPVALMSASLGGFGGVRAQLALRQSFVFTDSYVLPRPELMVSRAAEKFDEQGRLTDTAIQTSIRALLVALAAWTRQLAKA
jgi:chromate reductase